MINTSNAVSLAVNGVDYGGWLDASICAGIERQSRDFTVGITWKWPGADIPRRVRQGDKCQLRIGQDLVLTGYVFGTPIRYDDASISLAIGGRSMTADVVDCAADNRPSDWRKTSILNIVKALAAPYGITVVSEADAGLSPADHTVDPGETAFESIDRLLRMSRLLSTDDAYGRLVIAEPGSAGRASDRLELGYNVLTGEAPLDFSDVFSEYVCKGQRSGTDSDFGPAASEVEARVTDGRVTRRRTLVLNESGQMTTDIATKRVKWERENRISKALETRYAVQGWRQANGDLWRHNQIVRVVDPVIGFDRDMLISEIEYGLSEERGTIASMTVAPPEGFMPDPPEAERRAKKNKAKQGDAFEYLLPPNWEK